MWAVLEELRGSHQHAGRANSALRATVAKKRFLQRMQFSVESQAFYGLDVGSFSLHHWNQTAVHKLAVHADGTRAALAFTASFFGSGQMQIFPQNVEEALHWWDFDHSGFAIHVELNRGPAFARRCAYVRAHRAAVSSAGCAAARPR
jgi:hypothetical protein